VTARMVEKAQAESVAVRADFGVVNPRWRHWLSRTHRSALKTANGGYLRELRAQRLRGAPLTGPDGAATAARLNPRLPAVDAG
jgi:hypothetical protein